MKKTDRELVERIRGEIPDLERIVQRVIQAWSQVGKASGDQDAYLDSVALNLHGFYSGLERLFKLVAMHVDQGLPSGETWHRDLLGQVAKDFHGIRPAVVSPDTALALDEFRRFRHLVRNVYTLSLSPDKVAGLVTALPGVWAKLKAELLAFAEYLDSLAEE